MRRLAAVVATLALTLAACTGGGGGDDEDDPSLPLPEKAPSARGPATGPALEPKVLLAATDDLEELSGDLDTALVQRQSDAFISGKTVVGYSVDTISGFDLDSGEELWTAKLDLGGGTVCYVSQPDRAVKTFTVAYGEAGYCIDLATIRVSDGKVLKKSDKLSEILLEFEGENAGGPVNHLFTVEGKDHLVDNDGVVWQMRKGEPEPIARLEDRSYFQLHPTPEGDMLIGTRLGDRGKCRVDGFALPSFEHVWTQDNATLFPGTDDDCVISAAPGNPAWLVQQAYPEGETDPAKQRYYMVQLAPRTGEILGRKDAVRMDDKPLPEGEFELASAANQFDRALGLPGGDTVFAQVRGLTRYSLEGDEVVWDLDLSQLEMESTEEFALTRVLPQGITDDGYLVATVSNETEAEVIAVEVKTGDLVGRWPVPKEYGNGFQVEPGMTLFDGGIVLTRNFERWEQTFADYLDREEPKGDRYDIGVFTFPEPDAAAPKAGAVPTEGPVDADVKALGGIETPKGADGERQVGGVSTGTHVVSYVDNRLTALDARSGKQAWSVEIDADPKARVCDLGEPDATVKTVTLAFKGGGAKATCDTLVRYAVSDGEELARISAPAGSKGFSRLEVHEKVVHVITADRKVSNIVDGELVERTTLPRQPYQLERTPQDPNLLLATSSLKGGKDWAIDAYRLPSFEPVWSTMASTVLGKVDRRNPVSPWRGNGLWVSTYLGDTSKPGGKTRDVLAALDPETGEVTTRTGPVEREYLEEDLTVFHPTGAATASHSTVGFEDGDVVLPQNGGIMRYSLAEEAVRWSLDTSSITEAMEQDRLAAYVDEEYALIDGGKTVLVTLSNGVSAELMTVDAASGKITGRWNVPTTHRNGLQASPGVVTAGRTVALLHSPYSWDYAFAQTGRAVPKDQRYDVGLFRLPKAKK